MPCIICGDPETIEAHIFPRALYRMTAGSEQHSYEGSRFSEGVKYQAKGVYDRNLLCRRHEDAFRRADDYGIRFIRNFEKKSTPIRNGDILLIPNPQPHLLVRFVAGCIWRRAVSPVEAEGADLDLGNDEPRLRGFIFNGESSVDLPITIRKRTFTSQGEVLREIMWLPTKGFGPSTGSWSFVVFGIEFVIKTNPYSVPTIPPVFVANGKDPVWCVNSPPEELVHVEGILDIAVNMYRERYAVEQREKAGEGKGPDEHAA